jgi:hypothetical protein
VCRQVRIHALLSVRILSIARDFAANVDIPFHTPEEYFRHEEPRPFVRAFEPTAHLNERAEDPTSASTFNIQHLRCCPTTPISNISRGSDVHEAGHSRDHHVLRQSWGWEEFVLLETSAATRLRTSKPGHIKNCEC